LVLIIRRQNIKIGVKKVLRGDVHQK